MGTDHFIVDLHCHPNIKAFNSGEFAPTRNLWENIEHDNADTPFLRWMRKSTVNILKSSQSNLYNLAKGNVRVANVSLYPIEKGFLRLRNVPHVLVGVNRTEQVIELITGMPVERVVALKKDDNRYFADLQAEYEFVIAGQGTSPDGKASYEVVNNYAELQSALAKPNNIAVIVAIEGGHALGCGNPVTMKIGKEALKKTLTENIRQIKAWQYPPFTMNLAHHFYNQLCGHSASFKRPMNGILNQNKGKDKGLTELGRHVIRELLSRENGKRIIIDTKHMSIASRMEYYGFVRNFNYLNPNDKIPIVCSHGGVNGFKDMAGSIKQKDTFRKSKKSTFHRWSINVSDEEIRIIHESEGILGIMMDKGMLGGHNELEGIVANEDKVLMRLEFCRLIWLNIFQVIKAVKQPTAWDIIGLGTDYDGIINHIDPYATAADLPMLKTDLMDYLTASKLHKELWYGYTPTQLVNKILGANAMEFYKKYFV